MMRVACQFEAARRRAKITQQAANGSARQLSTSQRRRRSTLCAAPLPSLVHPSPMPRLLLFTLIVAHCVVEELRRRVGRRFGKWSRSVRWRESSRELLGCRGRRSRSRTLLLDDRARWRADSGSITRGARGQKTSKIRGEEGRTSEGSSLHGRIKRARMTRCDGRTILRRARRASLAGHAATTAAGTRARRVEHRGALRC